MISTSTAFEEVFARSDCEPIFKVTIPGRISGEWVAYSGGDLGDIGFDPPTVLAAEMDVLSRKIKIGMVSLSFLDDWIRPLMSTVRLRGLGITVELGAAEIDESEWETVFAGVIDETLPRAGRVEVECLDVFSVLKLRTINGYWAVKHPLDVMTDIFTKAGIPSALINSTSFDPDDAANDAISHFVVTRWGESANNTAVLASNAFDLTYELLQLLGGMIYVNDSGKLTFKVFDATDTNLDTWTPDDFADDIEQVSVADNVINRVTYRYQTSNSGQGGNAPWWVYQRNDTDSQEDHAYQGEDERIFEHTVDTLWLAGLVPVTESEKILTGVVSFAVVSMGYLPMAGMREAIGSQPTGAKLSATKPAYLRFPFGEIVKVHEAWCDPSRIATCTTIDPDTGAHTTEANVPSRAVLQCSRAALGTTQAEHPPAGLLGQSFLNDVTILVRIADQVLDRFAYGVAIIKCRTNLSKFRYELGDFVGLEWNEFLAYGEDGLDGTEKWEIIGKEVSLGESPGINWTLAAVNTNDNTKTLVVVDWSKNVPDVLRGVLEGLYDNRAGNKFVDKGLTAAIASGLQLTVGKGKLVGSGGSITRELTGDTTLTLTANKDVYVSADVRTGALVQKAVDHGGKMPQSSPTEVHVAKVVTGAAAVTSVNQSKMPVKSIATKQSAAKDGNAGLIKNGKLSQASTGNKGKG